MSYIYSLSLAKIDVKIILDLPQIVHHRLNNRVCDQVFCRAFLLHLNSQMHGRTFGQISQWIWYHVCLDSIEYLQLKHLGPEVKKENLRSLITKKKFKEYSC